MRSYTWDEYYASFDDWKEDKRAKNVYSLTSLGSAEELGDVINTLENTDASNYLLKKAVEAKREFTSNDLVDFLCCNDENLAVAAVYNSINILTEEDMEFLYGAADNELIKDICAKRNFALPEELIAEEEEEEENDDEDYEEDKEPIKIGFWGALFGAIGAANALDKKRPKKRGRRCDGNCAKCPPHYGYRYGRWYYGKGHAHGCEFGGNKGDGSLW
ncbi:MAG: hypothetical protein GX928_06885 [Ruminococcaceae bacterium]|nr:hypothetical protein [Oscillospiraceae bacterium]